MGEFMEVEDRVNPGLTGVPTELEQIRKVLEKYKKSILSKANVVGVGIGRKAVGGKETEELALVVFVEKKLPEVQLAAKDIIPKLLDNVKTDVIETGVIRALGNKIKKNPQGRTDRWRPAPGGVSIGHPKITAGTLGCLVRKGSDLFILSNNHVLANSNDAQKGDSILQPGPYDGGTLTNDKIALLEDFVPINFGETMCLLVLGIASVVNFFASLLGRKSRLRAVQVSANKVDCAIAKPINNGDVSSEILEIGIPSGMAEGAIGMNIRKSGRTTELTTGQIKQINASVWVSYGTKIALMEDQLVAGPMSQGGDSGSAVLNGSSNVIGLLFAGSETTTVINRIQNVTSALGVSIVT